MAPLGCPTHGTALLTHNPPAAVVLGLLLLPRLRAELAAIAKQTMPDQNGFKVASEKLLARISKFNNLEDASAQVRHAAGASGAEGPGGRERKRGRTQVQPPKTAGSYLILEARCLSHLAFGSTLS